MIVVGKLFYLHVIGLIFNKTTAITEYFKFYIGTDILNKKTLKIIFSN